jgi:hypothetical protein
MVLRRKKLKKMMMMKMTMESKVFLKKSTKLKKLKNSGRKDLISSKIKKRLPTQLENSKFKVKNLRTNKTISNKSLKRLKKKSRTSRVRK